MTRAFSICVFTATVLITAGAEPFSNKAEIIPSAVAKETREQVLRCFGTNHVPGVPLLDRTVDWNSFTNWPDEFTFEGHKYTLRLTDTSGGDYIVPLESRAAVRRGMRFLAVYGGSPSRLPLRIAGGWNADGSMRLKSLDYSKSSDYPRIVFSHQFHPTGRLYYFARYDAATNYLVDYFDVRGELAGTIRGGGLATPTVYRWRGEKVHSEVFFEGQRACYHDFGR